MSFQCSSQQFVRWAGQVKEKGFKTLRKGHKITPESGSEQGLEPNLFYTELLVCVDVLVMVRLYLPIQLFTHPFTHSTTDPHMYPPVQPLTYPPIHSPPNYPLTHSPADSSTHPPINHSPIYIAIHLPFSPSLSLSLPPFLSSFRLFIENLEVRHLDGCWGDEGMGTGCTSWGHHLFPHQ